MKIKLYWPNCDLHFKNTEFRGNDAFFIECNLEEAKEQKFSRLAEDQISQCVRDYDPIPQPGFLKLGIETNKMCFLVTKDQKSLLPEPWYFPYAGQWNDDNPFREIKAIEIKNVDELANMVFELDEDDIGN